MSFNIERQFRVVAEERRLIEFSLNAHGLRGDEFQSAIFSRESVFLADDGTEIKRTRDPNPFEFTPDTIAQNPALKAAIGVIYRYIDDADRLRLGQTS